jgi:Domain of unknown function (DUF1844)
MSEKKHEQSGFKVTDRRLFTSDGELRNDVPEEPAAPQTQPVQTESAPPVQAESAPLAAKPSVEVAEAAPEPEREMPLPPSASEQEAQATAYRQSSKDLDSQVELSGHSAKDFEMTFERFMASLYMTAMLQLGMMREQGGQPRIDIIGARQTIDTLSLIAEKTKGNLTPVEQNFLQNSLYELRMAYVEVTNALTRPPQAGPAGAGPGPVPGRVPGTGTRGR